MTDYELINKLVDLLKRSLPYVVAHYERSRTGFGSAARNLMNEIKELLGVR